MQHTKPHIVAGATVAWLCVYVFAADTALSWEFVPNLELAVETRDNPRLDTLEPGLVPGLVPGPIDPATDDVATMMLFNGQFALSNMGPRNYLFLEPRVRVYAASDVEDEDLESEDLFFDARGQRRWEKSAAGFNSSFSSARCTKTRPR